MATHAGLKLESSAPALFRIQKELEGAFTDADTFQDEPVKEDGIWHLSITRADKQVEVVWCPKRGFGVSLLSDSDIFTGHDFVSTDEGEALAEAKRLLTN